MTALVLSGGGARALAHVGALLALKKKGIEYDFIVGTSMGALIGVGYSYFNNAELLRDVTMNFLRKVRFNMRYSNYISGNFRKGFVKLACFFMNIFSGIPFLERNLRFLKRLDWNSLKVPVYITAVDLKSGELVVFKEGDAPLETAIRASIAMPGVLKPVEWNDRLLVDGGVFTNLPVGVAKDLGADKVIALDATRIVFPEHKTANSSLMIIDSYRDMMITEWEKSLADVYINYEITDVDSLEFSKGRYVIEKGYDVVMNWEGGE